MHEVREFIIFHKSTIETGLPSSSKLSDLCNIYGGRNPHVPYVVFGGVVRQ